jgi:UDP-N-acetylglucosamine--N-acetylmuramyl-(pentapeptide) pyrophosphoryl-undecaprenol N-acetylglucosamine transferase
MLGDLRPRAVLGLGGFAAGAMVARAARSGVRSAVLNPDAVPGRANRFLARRAEAVFAQFAGSGERFPSAVRAKVREIGCPVRPGFATADRDEAVARFGLSPDRRTLLVCGGSSGAKLINEAITALAGDLAARAGAWQVLHVAGAELYEPTRAAWGAGDAPVVVLPYCDRMDLAYAAADLLVGRCGASTAAELAATDTPAVVLPYPFHADRQQALNAEPLAAAGAVRVVEDRKDPAVNADALRRELLPLLDDADALAAMRRAAEALPGSDAAAIVAAWLE